MICLYEYVGLVVQLIAPAERALAKVTKNDTLIFEKISQIKQWILTNKDSYGTIDSSEFSKAIMNQKLNPKEVISKLCEEGFIFKVPKLNKLGVTK